MFKLSDYSPVESCYFWCGPEEGVWVSKALAAGFVFLPAPHFAELKEIIKKKKCNSQSLVSPFDLISTSYCSLSFNCSIQQLPNGFLMFRLT